VINPELFAFFFFWKGRTTHSKTALRSIALSHRLAWVTFRRFIKFERNDALKMHARLAWMTWMKIKLSESKSRSLSHLCSVELSVKQKKWTELDATMSAPPVYIGFEKACALKRCQPR
jgi:hypothetical protein